MTTPVRNTQIVGQGLARLTSAYIGQPNCRALLAAYLQPLQDIEDAYFDILEARVLSMATMYDLPQTNIVFDQIGALIGCARVGQSDFSYRALIYLEIAVNRATGRMSDWSRFAQILTPFADAFAFLDGDNADFTFGVWNLQLAPPTVAAQLSRAVPNGVGAILAFSTWEEGNDFEFTWSGDGTIGEDGFSWSNDDMLGGLLVAAFAL